MAETTIAVAKKTKLMLAQLGKKGETYDAIIVRLLSAGKEI